MNLQHIIDAPLVDLGVINDSRFSGVFSPAAEVNNVGAGVTRQFLEDAEIYHEKYFDIGYWNYQLGVALAETKNTADDVNLILDIGSGSGPSVFALLELFKNAHVVATDISPNLLAILRSALKAKQVEDRCTTACLDLNRRWFKGQPFDLAIGAAILHHLFEPHRLVEQVFTTLRSGGIMAFFEPFEPGNATLAIIYRNILSEVSYRNELDPRISRFLEARVEEIKTMKCEPKDFETYKDIDDKWTFTRSYFEDIGRNIQARETIIFPLNFSENPFSGKIRTDLRLGLGLEEAALPEWAWRIVTDVEASLSTACKKDLLIEGCIAFRK